MTLIDPKASATQTFDWGVIKWFITPGEIAGAGLTFGEVILLPGQGHDRHNHPNAEEVLYVLSGEGQQMVDDNDPFTIRSGDTIYIPAGAYHSTVNSAWEPLRLLAVYNPGGPELDLEKLPDFRRVASSGLPKLVRGE